MAEVLAAGFFGSIWIILLIVKPLTPESLWTAETLVLYKDYAHIFLISLLICWYSLGWLINLFSYRFFEVAYFIKFKNEVAGSVQIHRQWSTLVHHHANQSLRAELSEDRRIMRIARTGTLNFLLIAIALLTIDGINPWLALLPLGLSIGSGCQTIQRGHRYYHAIWDFHAHLVTEHELERIQLDKKEVNPTVETVKQ